MVRIGFGKTDLETALRPQDPVREERVEAVSLYAGDAQNECVWVVLDFMDFDLHVVRTLTEAVAEKTKIHPDHVHIVTTHNHGGGTPELSVLATLAASCAAQAKAAARPAEMRFARTVCDKQVNIIRRKYIPEIDGVTTLYYGASEKEGFDASPFVENAVSSLMEGNVVYCGRRETQRPFDPFLPGDSDITAAEFRDKEGNTLGTVVRFAAHAVCCNRHGSFSSDYPYHIRSRMEETFGGTALFFNGPCGDIAPGMENKFDGTERVLGTYIAEKAASALRDAPFSPIRSFRDDKFTAKLLVREGVKKNFVDTDAPMPAELPARLRVLERQKYAALLGFLRGKYTAGEDDPGDTIEVSLGALRLGELVFAALPGESFSVTGKALCEAFPDVELCTVTEHGRTVMYIPPAGQCAEGGYESVCRITKSGEEATLLRAATAGVRRFLAE